MAFCIHFDELYWVGELEGIQRHRKHLNISLCLCQARTVVVAYARLRTRDVHPAKAWLIGKGYVQQRNVLVREQLDVG